MVKVKVCGITNLEDAILTQQLGADAIGFIFTKKSPRYISPKAAKKILDKLGAFAVRVGVFLDNDKAEVVSIAKQLKLDVLQFHGNESPAYCRQFKKDYKVIKVIFPDKQNISKILTCYKVDGFLFDVKFEDKQKGKKTLPQDILKKLKVIIKGNDSIIVSAGLTPNNVGSILKLKPYAVDVSSGVEKFIGKKDAKLVKEFIRKVKQ